MPLIRASPVIYTYCCVTLLPFLWLLSVFLICYFKFSISSLHRWSIFDPLCHRFLIHFTFLSTSLPLPRFGLIPHSECSQKHVGKVVRVLEFDLWLCCCVISSKICTFYFCSFFCFISRSEGQVGSISHFSLHLM